MLRASSKITINSETITSNNGFILSTVINLNGLILRADRPIPQIIKDFLISKNIQVSRVRIPVQLDETTQNVPHYEYYIRLYGTFSILKSDIVDFINNPKHTTLIEEQSSDLDQIPKADYLQSSIEKQHELCYKKLTYVNIDTGNTWDVPSVGVIAGRECSINTNKLQSSQPICGRDAITVTAQEIISSGRIFSLPDQTQINVGLMAPFFSKKRIQFKSSSTQLEDTIVAAENITLESTEDNQNTLLLAINTDIDWLNNPYHDFTSLFKAKSTVQRCELEEVVVDRQPRQKLKTIIPRPKW